MPVHTYSKDGAMRTVNRTDPVYFPNSKGGPRAYPERYAPPSWQVDGDVVRTAFATHTEDNDFVQASALVRDVMDGAARDRLVANPVAQLLNGVTEPVLPRSFDYPRNIDKSYGDRVEQGVRNGRA
jgi:catalase